ncbi:MAG: hypothetical protein DCC63_14805 [Nitrospira sp.]|nr:MAG: hypothetical protein DCC63_14805 [Nitrospira sp.]
MSPRQAESLLCLKRPYGLDDVARAFRKLIKQLHPDVRYESSVAEIQALHDARRTCIELVKNSPRFWCRTVVRTLMDDDFVKAFNLLDIALDATMPEVEQAYYLRKNAIDESDRERLALLASAYKRCWEYAAAKRLPPLSDCLCLVRGA